MSNNTVDNPFFARFWTFMSAHEPEPVRPLTPIARQAALSAPVPVTVSDSTIESLDAGEPFDAVVCSLVLCSVDQPEAVLQQIFSILRPGGELRYLEHIASAGARGRLQRLGAGGGWGRGGRGS